MLYLLPRQEGEYVKRIVALALILIGIALVAEFIYGPPETAEYDGLKKFLYDKNVHSRVRCL